MWGIKFKDFLHLRLRIDKKLPIHNEISNAATEFIIIT